MITVRPNPFSAILLLLFLAVSPAGVSAAELFVEPSPTDSTHFSSIQAAINEANRIITTNASTTTSYTIIVEPGTYSEAITLQSKISLRGRETARTILTGGGSGTVITAANVTAVSIRNFTIIDATAGISVTGNSSVLITNNVFQVGTGGTAVQVQNSTATEVINNTFFRCGTGVLRDADTVKIINNIFAENTVAAISPGNIASLDKILNNGFFLNNDDGPKGTDFIPNNTTVTDTNPQFVDTAGLDFHLLFNSPAKDNGTSTITDALDNSRSDMGAYGGADADTVPFPVSGVIVEIADSSSITIDWTENDCYLVTGYRVWYGSAPGRYDGTGSSRGDSPITLSTTTSIAGILLEGLNTAATVTPAAPVLDRPQPSNNSLILSWTPVDGATSYRVYYGTTSPPLFSTDVGNTTTHQISELTNGVDYYVAVSAIAQSTVYVAVTAFYKGGEVRSSGTVTPGIAQESAYSDEAFVSFGSPQESGLSNIEREFPEALTPYPVLPNQGCFIATAAFGHYSDPEVQSLRKFRDRYLITNMPGRAFVRWYYSVSPVAADFIRRHPGFKPVVRAALYPVVGAAMAMTKTPWIALIPAAGSMILLPVLILQRRRSRGNLKQRH